MDEIEPVERMLCVLDAAVHVHAAIPTGVPLNGGIGIHDFEPVGILGNTELVARHNGDLREQCARGLPAFGASTDVIIGALGRNAHLDVPHDANAAALIAELYLVASGFDAGDSQALVVVNRSIAIILALVGCLSPPATSGAS